ncbi:MAG: YitT family protein [Rhizobiaceae bacterium]
MSTEPERHSLYEDGLAILTGTFFVAIGLSMYVHATLLTGGSAGLALLIHYVSGWSFSAVFFVVNLPFYILAVRRMGWAFTIRTFLAVLMISVFARLTPLVISYSHLQPVFAAVAGGALQGVGLLILFRHRTGLGGFNILALYLQETRGIRAGWLQLGLDLCILAAAFYWLDWQAALLSVLGALALNVTLGINHRPGRYLGVS